jgi:Kef-type K+ transport system membrane component KefB/Trk K+ transport system NAD-binding subunit
MQHEFPFLSLLIITGLAAILPLFSSWLRRLRLPLIVAEILAGMIVGRSGLNLIEPGPALDFLATFGFTYLMFLSGLEIDLSAFRFSAKDDVKSRFLRNPVALGLVNFAVTVTTAFVAALVLERFALIRNPLIMALILSTTSLGIVMPVLRERGLIATRYGQTLLITSVAADFGTLLLLTVFIAAISHGLKLDLLLVLILLAAFAIAVRLGRLAFGITGLRRLIEELAHTTVQIRVRATFALMVAFIVLSKWLGMEIILGAFLAGAVISLLSKREDSSLHLKMDAIGFGFFIPIFFIMVGVRFDLPALMDSHEALLLVLLLLGVAFAIKFFAALLYRLHFSWRETLAAGGLLSARLSLIIAASAIALELGVIDKAVNSAIVLLAVISCTLAPMIFNRILPAATLGLRRGIILASLGQMSTLLAERLRQANEEVRLVGQDPDRAKDIKRRGLPLIEGDPTRPEVLQSAGADTVETLMAISSNDEINLATCRLAKDLYGVPNLIALAGDPKVAGMLNEMGVRVVQPQLATTIALEGALQFPAAFDMLANAADGVTVREADLSNSLLDGMPLRRVEIPGDALVLGLRRNGQVLVPHGDTILRLGDVLMLVGHPDGLHKAMAWIDPPPF